MAADPLPPPEPWRPVLWQVALALVAALALGLGWWWLHARARQRARAVVALIPQAGFDSRRADYHAPPADGFDEEGLDDEPTGAVAEPESAARAEAAAPETAAIAPPASPDAAVTLSAELIEAEFTLTAFVLRYAAEIANDGASEARGLAIRAALIEAGPGSDAALDRFFAEAEAIMATPAKLAAGARQRIVSELRLPLAELRPLTIADKPCLVPMLALVVRHDGLNMKAAFARRAWIIGREADPPRLKMAPFRVDRGPRRLQQIGLRPHRDG